MATHLMGYKGVATVCPIHGGGVVDSPDRQVLVGGSANLVSVTGDMCNCPGAPNTIMAGATDILAGNLPVAGMKHMTAHNTGSPTDPVAFLLVGSANVIMGGGMTVGPVAAALAACMLLPTGRAGESPIQSGENCGVEAMRQMINAKRRREGQADLREDEFLDETLNHGESSVTVTTGDRWDATLIQKDREMEPFRTRFQETKKAYEDSKGFFGPDEQKHQEFLKAKREYEDASNTILVDQQASMGPDQLIHEQAEAARERQKQRAASATSTRDFKDPNRAKAGGTLPAQQSAALARHGIESGPMSQDGSSAEDMKALEEKIGQGHGVLVGVDTRNLWNIPPGQPSGGHAILVTAVEYGEDGEVTGYVTNDTVKGCGRRVSRSELRTSLRRDLQATVTAKPIW